MGVLWSVDLARSQLPGVSPYLVPRNDQCLTHCKGWPAAHNLLLGQVAALAWDGWAGDKTLSMSGLQDSSRNHSPHSDLADGGPERGRGFLKVT